MPEGPTAARVKNLPVAVSPATTKKSGRWTL
jgi:hypothetical protein